MSMRSSAGARVLVGVGLLVCAATLEAQPPLPLGNEFQVTTFTATYQSVPGVSRASNGGFVVVWVSFNQDHSQGGVFARRFSAAGVPLAVEFLVNSYTSGSQQGPDVALDASGDFVVVWPSNGQDGYDFGIFARRFDAAGTPLAVEFQVNTRTGGSQYYPVVGIDADGDFVVAWNSFPTSDGNGAGIFAQRFDSTGARRGTEFLVNSYTPGDQYRPDVALDDDGDFVVVWRSDNQDGSSRGIFAKRFTSAGAAGVESQVNTYTPGSQDYPVVAIDGDGDFVVAWQSEYQDGSGSGVFARRFNVLGTPQATEFLVNAHTPDGQSAPAIAMRDSGAFVVSWVSSDGDGAGIFAREFDSTGSPRNGDFQVNTYTTSQQVRPDVAIAADGDFVVAWDSLGQDGYSHGIFAQRFSPAAVLDIDANGEVTALTDGLLVLRFLFGFTGTTLTNGVVGPNCTRCNAAAIEPYLQGLV